MQGGRWGGVRTEWSGGGCDQNLYENSPVNGSLGLSLAFLYHMVISHGYRPIMWLFDIDL